MEVMLWVGVGLIAASFSRFAFPREVPLGLFGELFMGVAGALAGGYLFQSVPGPRYGGPFGGIAVAFLTASLALWVVRIFTCWRAAQKAATLAALGTPPATAGRVHVFKETR